MGKSPGKWIKAVLLGKKSTKASFPEDAATEKKTSIASKEPSRDLALNPPVISDTLPKINVRSGEKTEPEKGETTNLQCDSHMLLPENQSTEAVGVVGLSSANNAEIFKQEQAATMAQAAFRGYLARRAFQALKGIIRLQALFRGHLVRRQAVATLRCMGAIVKFQALIRGRMVVGLSSAAHGEHKNYSLEESLVNLAGLSTCMGSEKLLRKAFFIKLLSSSPSATPLSLPYDPDEPNSAWSWLVRWSSSQYWELPTCSLRKNRNQNQQPKSVQEQSQSELERVKRSLRKITASSLGASDKPDNSPKQATTSPTPEETTNITLPNDDVTMDEPHRSSIEEHGLNSVEVIDFPPLKEEDQTMRRRRSLPTKQEINENVCRNTPSLPSYMAATESAKAKLRAQGNNNTNTSRFVEDGGENGLIRRHSSSPVNGKLSSSSPRVQRLVVQANGKERGKSNRRLSSSKDEKVMQAEWRR